MGHHGALAVQGSGEGHGGSEELDAPDAALPPRAAAPSVLCP